MFDITTLMATEELKSVDVFRLQEKIRKQQAIIDHTRTLIHRSRRLCAESKHRHKQSQILLEWLRQDGLVRDESGT